jgi:hypothetical protein
MGTSAARLILHPGKIEASLAVPGNGCDTPNTMAHTRRIATAGHPDCTTTGVCVS